MTHNHHPHYTPSAIVSVIILTVLLAIGIWLFLTGETFNSQSILTTNDSLRPESRSIVVPH